LSFLYNLRKILNHPAILIDRINPFALKISQANVVLDIA